MEYYNYGDGYSSYDTTLDSANIFGTLAAVGGIMWLFFIVTYILLVVSMWKVFTKLGKPGWAAIIPYYNFYVMCQIADKPWWYLLLFLVPFANIYVMYVLYNGIAQKLGKSTGFTIGMILLPYVFWPILAFGKNVMVENTSNDFNNQVNNTQMQNQSVNYETNNMMNDNLVNQTLINESMNATSQQVVTNEFNNMNSQMTSPVNMNQVNEFSQSMQTPVNNTFDFNQNNNSANQEQSNDYQTVAPSFDNFNAVNTSVNNVNDSIASPAFNDISDNVDVNYNTNNFANQISDSIETTQISNANETVAPVFNTPNEVNSNTSNMSEENTSLWSNQNNNSNNGLM